MATPQEILDAAKLAAAAPASAPASGVPTNLVSQAAPTPAATVITSPPAPAAALIATDALPFYKQAPFYITLMLMVPVYFVVVVVLWPNSGYTDSTRVQVVTAVLGIMALAGSFWLGTSLSSSKKDAALQAAASAPTTVVNNAAPSTAPTNISQ